MDKNINISTVPTKEFDAEKNTNLIVYFFAILSVLLTVIIVALLFLSHHSSSHIITPTVPKMITEKDTSGKHCAHDSLIINAGNIECESAENISAILQTSPNRHNQQISGFSCLVSYNQNPEYYFYDYWCENSENSFFGSFHQHRYAQFPSGLSHWIKDSRIFIREHRPGIDFRTHNNTVQCIIYKALSVLLACSGANFPKNTTQQNFPNNLIFLHPTGKAIIGFGQTSEFSYGKNAILEPKSTLYYRNYVCSASDNEMSCYSLAHGGKGFSISPHQWNPNK